MRDAAQRAALGDVYRQAVHDYLASAGAAGRLYADDPERPPVQQRVGDSVAYLGGHLGEVPVLVVPVPAGAAARSGQPGPVGVHPPGGLELMLAARARGLGTAWTTLHLADEDEVAAILALPSDIRTAVLIPTAYFTGETFRPAVRAPSTRCCTSTGGDAPRSTSAMIGDH